MMIMMGKRIFSCLVTLRVGFMTMARSFLVVMSLMMGGCMTGMSAIYEYAAMAIAASRSGASALVSQIAVGPSAPPTMPMDAASGPVKPKHTARKNAT